MQYIGEWKGRGGLSGWGQRGVGRAYVQLVVRKISLAHIYFEGLDLFNVLLALAYPVLLLVE